MQANIENFGGDPDRVTIFGQSSGGTSVLTLVASPLAKGLFHRAIAMSSSVAIDMPLVSQLFASKVCLIPHANRSSQSKRTWAIL